MSSQPNHADIVRILSADPIWGGYALADLQARFAPHCQWTVGQEAENGTLVEGLVLFFDLLTPTAIVTVGAGKAVEAALAQAKLPDTIYLNVRNEHLPYVAKHYDFPEGTIGFHRMYLPADQSIAAIRAGAYDDDKCVRLRAEDADRLRQLYSHGGSHTPDAFDTFQLEDGVFIGISGRDGMLVAAGGTHIVDRRQGIAAIGNMYTHPSHRKCGLAGSILRAIVAKLHSDDIQTIILNVDQRNSAAQRLYLRYGFQTHCTYWEGVGIRNMERGVQN